MLKHIKKIIPKKLFKTLQPTYHLGLAYTGALLYRFPSRQTRVVAITGTKGKTSTAEMVNAILEEAGYKTALGGSLRFKVGSDSKLNPFGMSMPGRSYLQKFLRRAVNEKCDWVVLEMTSEGAKQYRHMFIELDAFIFTNLAPEHIESHGSFEQYKKDKQRIAQSLSSSSKQRKVAIINSSDKHAEDFTPHNITEVINFDLEQAKLYRSGSDGTTFQFDGVTIRSPLKGEFNILNMLAAANFAKAFGIETPVISRALSKLSTIRGRAEHITLPSSNPHKKKQTFDIVVDYAHTIESLEALYKTFPNQKKICVLGNTGGGRDTWKREGMAKIADTYCDSIYLTTEDPYDEDPLKIIEDMKRGITKHIPTIIISRKEAIRAAITEAEKNDAVLMTGMGSQQYMCVANGKKLDWDDARIAREELEKKFEDSL
jgi:UDP-N-acetylmuramoyl-L-alanyl-D-glutamate--2,6-diaminopimelate ligase